MPEKKEKPEKKNLYTLQNLNSAAGKTIVLYQVQDWHLKEPRHGFSILKSLV